MQNRAENGRAIKWGTIWGFFSFLVLAIFIAPLHTQAQQSEKYYSPYADFNRAEELFEKEQFSAARKEYRSFIENYKGSLNDAYIVKAYYYEGRAALELFNNDAVELLEKFNLNYPESIYKNDSYFRLGRYFYQKKDYENALVWLGKLTKQSVEPEYQDEYFFKLGDSYFREKKFPQAKVAFFEIKQSTSQYGPPALYYYSHICYTDGTYQTALEGFQKLMTDNRFKTVVPYYITQIYYFQGNYEEVTKFGPDHLDSIKPAELTEMHHLIGDAFYKIGKFDESVPYLEKYNLAATTTRDDDYQLAYAYFKSNSYGKAVKFFDKVSRTKDTLGQIALYHAGECYMQINELAYARTAFEAAAQLDMDLMIQEDALYHYAILSYKLDLNPYDESVDAFQAYLTKYPNSPRKSVIYEYLVNVFTNTKNFSKALESLDKLPTKDLKLKSAYQIIAFNRAVELHQKGEYDKAIEAFKLVAKYPINDDISAKGIYWTADATYRKKQYKNALALYRKFLTMPSNYLSDLRADAKYNIGYCYVMLKDDTQSKDAFSDYLSTPGLKANGKKADAYMRLGDACYLLKDNVKAIEAYTAVLGLKKGFEDQALYYLARLQGLQGNRIARIQHLQDIINNYPTSTYVQNAVYDVATTYYNNNENEKAMRYFEQLVKDYPKSIQLKDALHNIGNIYFKKGDFVKAESYFKRVLSEYGTEAGVCKREVRGLADIYKAQSKLDKLEQLPSLYPCADSIKFELEDTYYEEAMKIYEKDSNFVEAIVKFDAYLGKFPTGKYKNEILNHKADALYRTKREADAVAIYVTTLTGVNDAFTPIASQRSAKYYYNKKEYETALPYYARLEPVTSNPELISTARIGLMRCHYLLENYTSAAEYAKKVLWNSQITPTIRLEAQFSKGMSLAKTEHFVDGLPSLEFVVKNTTTVLAAEAQFTIAEGHFKKNDLAKTEETIRALLKMKPGYDYWIAKGLILQTRVLIAKKDLFQAENTIASVIENYPVETDGIQTEAGALYDEIMQMKSDPIKEKPKTPENTVIDVEDTTPTTKEKKP